MVEVASDWNYANTGIFDESAFIFRRRDARKLVGALTAGSAASPLPTSLEHDEVARVGRARACKSCLKALSARSRRKDFRESAFLPALSLTRHLHGAQTRTARVNCSMSSAQNARAHSHVKYERWDNRGTECQPTKWVSEFADRRC
jgi:hypothetical protein